MSETNPSIGSYAIIRSYKQSGHYCENKDEIVGSESSSEVSDIDYGGLDPQP